MSSSETRDTLAVAKEIAAATDTDLIFYNGNVDRPCDEALIRECMKRGTGGRRKNVMLVLVTYGGDPDAAFRMARCLQHSYERFSLYVPGFCKSAGTLLALGAHELIISDHGELGPLDIQMAKKDEFFDRQSGLTVMAALEALQKRAYGAAEEMLLQIETTTGGLLSMQTATTLAAQLVVGMYAPIASQIDPMHVGEASRQLLIAEQYGSRLSRHSRNLKTPNALLRMITGFPSHGFVVDRTEAKDFFTNVREPTKLELELVESVGVYGRRVKPARQPGFVVPAEVLQFWTTSLTADKSGDADGNTTVRKPKQPGRTSARPRPRIAPSGASHRTNGRAGRP